MAMDDLVYQQPADFSVEKLILKEDRLLILESSLGMSRERVVRIGDIASGPEVELRRFSRFFILPIAGFGVIAVVIWKLAESQIMTDELPLFSAVVFFTCLWHALKGLKPVEIARFRDKNGEIIIELYRPRNRNSDSAICYTRFLSALNKRLVEHRNTS